MDELRLILLITGAIIILLIYLWGTRKQIKARLAEKRRRRLARGQSPALNMERQTAEMSDADSSARFADAAADSEAIAKPPLAFDIPVEKTVEKAGETVKTEDAGNASPLAEPVDEGVAEEGVAEEGVAEEPLPSTPPFKPAQTYDFSERRKLPSGPTELKLAVTVMAPQGRFFTGAEIQTSCHDLELQLNEKGIWDCYMDIDMDDGPVFGVGHLKEPGTFNTATIETLATPGLLLFSLLPGPSKAVAAVDMMLATAGELARKLGGTVCDDRRKKMSPQAMIYMRTEAAEFDQRMQEMQ